MPENGPFLLMMAAMGLWIAGALGALLTGLRPSSAGRGAAFGCSMAASVGLFAAGLFGLFRPASPALLIPGIVPSTSIVLALQPFSAYFLLLIGGIGFVSTLYAVGYFRGDRRTRSLVWLPAGWQLFLAFMAGVAAAGNIFTFLLFWEAMSIVSCLLVIYEYEQANILRAGFLYAGMTHIGTLFLIIAFFLLGHYGGSGDFARLAHVHPPAGAGNLIFLFALIAFGTKAGLVPLHIWLPQAHPSAPSPEPALMSGVMLKLALYGFLLFTAEFLPAGPYWWGLTTLAAGLFSALFGALHAVNELHAKRILAYSSIENMGLLFAGLGLFLLFRTAGLPHDAAFALIAVLLHAASHAMFKSLLFMGAGSVEQSAGTSNLNRLGGLIRRMPWTALFVLVGMLSLAAMPPLAGFAGEWLLLESAFSLGYTGSSLWLAGSGLLTLAALALAGSLAAFAAVRFFAMIFLAKPRSDAGLHAEEASPAMRLGMLLPAAGSLLLGIVPYPLVRAAQAAAGQLLAGGGAGPSGSRLVAVASKPTSWLALPLPAPASRLGEAPNHGLALGVAALLLFAFGAAAWFIVRRIGGRTQAVRAETWACGIPLTARMTYTASGFSRPVRTMLGRLLMARRKLTVERDPNHPAFVRGYVYASRLPLLAEEFLYQPLMRALVAGATWFRKIQNGILQSYLLVLMITLVAVLIWAVGR